jgi:hypothetical protein
MAVLMIVHCEAASQCNRLAGTTSFFGYFRQGSYK